MRQDYFSTSTEPSGNSSERLVYEHLDHVLENNSNARNFVERSFALGFDFNWGRIQLRIEKATSNVCLFIYVKNINSSLP